MAVSAARSARRGGVEGVRRDAVRVPSDRGGTGNRHRPTRRPAVATGAAQGALGGEAVQQAEQGLLADAEGGAQGRRGHGGGGAPHELEGARPQGIPRALVVILADEARAGAAGGVGDAEAQAQGRRTGGGAVLDAQFEGAVGAEAAQVEIGVPPMPRSA